MGATMEAEQNEQPKEGSITQLEGSLISIAQGQLATILRYFQAFAKGSDDDDLLDEYSKSFVAIHTLFMLLHMSGSGLSLEGAKALGKVEADFHAAYYDYSASFGATAH